MALPSGDPGWARSPVADAGHARPPVADQGWWYPLAVDPGGAQPPAADLGWWRPRRRIGGRRDRIQGRRAWWLASSGSSGSIFEGVSLLGGEHAGLLRIRCRSPRRRAASTPFPSLSLSLCRQPVGFRLARPVKLVMLHGPARHGNQPIVSCLGQRLGPWSCEAQPWRHVVPCRPDSHRVVLSRARAGLPVGHLYW